MEAATTKRRRNEAGRWGFGWKEWGVSGARVGNLQSFQRYQIMQSVLFDRVDLVVRQLPVDVKDVTRERGGRRERKKN